MATRLNAARPDFDVVLSAFLARVRAAGQDVDAAVCDIIEQVRKSGDGALVELTKRFDHVSLRVQDLRVPPSGLDEAVKAIPKDLRAALEGAAERIRDYHARQVPTGALYVDAAGVTLGTRWTPIAAVGIYVPGGTAAYPSSVLMNALPAKAAGVDRIAMAAPFPDGRANQAVLAAAAIAGVEEVYRVGGAQAIAAFAFGTDTVARVDKIVGPGNAYVASAKRQLFGTVGIDLVAGPSEIMVIADGDNDPAWIAADLMSQAEHDENAQAILITDQPDFADRVEMEIELLLKTLPRAAIARVSWERNGAVILIDDLALAPALVDRFAPEHVEIATVEPDKLAARIRHAGAIFLGRYAPEAIGDYVAGPSHVLPTSGSARFSSGLSVHDFVKRTSIVGCEREGFEAIGSVAATLADAEGLEAHARSLRLRLVHPRSG